MLYYKPLVLKIDNTEITSVDTFNLLGLLIYTNLNWKPLVQKTTGKIAKAIGVINRLKFVVPQNILVTLYNSLILSHLNCTLAWGYEHKRITKLQKKNYSNNILHTPILYLKKYVLLHSKICLS